VNAVKNAYWAIRKGLLLDAIAWLLPTRLGESLYGRHKHRQLFGEWPNLARPRRFAEHILRLKLDEARSPLRTRITDKELAKDFIRSRVGDGLTARTIAVLRSKQQVLDYRFPDDCAIKATHTSGNVFLRRDGASVDLQRILRWFDRNYYYEGREPNYRPLQPKVIVEELLTEIGGEAPRDYKVFCFQGVPAFIQVDTDRFTDHRRNLYSTRWKELDCAIRYPRSATPTRRPARLDQMLSLASRLSDGFSFLRVDFFVVEGRLVVGELTNHPDGGGTIFTPERADRQMARLFVDPRTDIERLVGTVEREPAGGVARAGGSQGAPVFVRPLDRAAEGEQAPVESGPGR
jgi:hypothetical protein